jgi:nucleoside phosphorylase
LVVYSFLQNLGDYVLAHAYLREDHVLDEELPTSVPIPALSEVQLALENAGVLLLLFIYFLETENQRSKNKFLIKIIIIIIMIICNSG